MCTMTELEREALRALRAVISCTGRVMGQKSTGANYCHILESGLEIARAALAKLEAASKEKTDEAP